MLKCKFNNLKTQLWGWSPVKKLTCIYIGVVVVGGEEANLVQLLFLFTVASGTLGMGDTKGKKEPTN